MRRERSNGGAIKRRVAVERAHQERNGEFKPFWLIAVELYDLLGTQSEVRAAIETTYGVTVCEKTASLWINRGLVERESETEQTPRAMVLAA